MEQSSRSKVQAARAHPWAIIVGANVHAHPFLGVHGHDCAHHSTLSVCCSRHCRGRQLPRRCRLWECARRWDTCRRSRPSTPPLSGSVANVVVVATTGRKDIWKSDCRVDGEPAGRLTTFTITSFIIFRRGDYSTSVMPMRRRREHRRVTVVNERRRCCW